MSVSKHSLAIISIILVMMIWGSSFAITRSSVSGFPPIYFALLRHLVASLVLLVLIFLRRKKLRMPGPLPWTTLILMGLAGVGFYYIFFNISLTYTTASTGALIQGFIPAVITLMAAVFLKEKLNERQIAGIIISVSGVALISFMAAHGERASNPVIGNVLMIGAVLMWSTYTILSKKLSAFDPLLVTTICTVVGSILLLPATYIELRHRPFPDIPFPQWISICYLGVFSSAVCYILYNGSLNYLSAVQVGNFLNLDPVIGAIIAMIVLKEGISAWQIAGSVLVLAGIWLSSSQKKEYVHKQV